MDVKRLVSKNAPEIHWFEKGRNADRIVMLAGDKREADQIAQGVGHGNDLR